MITISTRDYTEISIHALRVEGDLCSSFGFPPFVYFYPRPPGGGRPHDLFLPRFADFISIHALRVEGDRAARKRIANLDIFLSTPSGWRATGCSISGSRYRANFYPRPPGGGRQFFASSISVATRFLSTPSGWRATVCKQSKRRRTADFYPRPPGGGRRWSATPAQSHPRYFYPRPPGGGRHAA